MDDLVKKKTNSRVGREASGPISQQKRSQTLAHIVLNNGLKVDIPKLPTSTSQLTISDHMLTAIHHAALAISCVKLLTSRLTPPLAMSCNMNPIKENLEGLMNHIYCAMEGLEAKSAL